MVPGFSIQKKQPRKKAPQARYFFPTLCESKVCPYLCTLKKAHRRASWLLCPGFCDDFGICINNIGTMKKDIHPNYRPVVFQDLSSDFKFLTRSCVEAKEETVWEDGKTYPVVKIEVSSESHPFYTGKTSFVSRAGRVERFNQKYGNRPKK
jgi:large subunit ribosomal protein L31